MEEASQEFYEAFSTYEGFSALDIYSKPLNKKRDSLVDAVEVMDETEPVDLRQAMNAQSQEPYKIAITEAVLEPFHYNANSAINLSLHVKDATKFSLKYAARLEQLSAVTLFWHHILPHSDLKDTVRFIQH